jgi:DNA polymerase III epsilon subunit-like protein
VAEKSNPSALAAAKPRADQSGMPKSDIPRPVLPLTFVFYDTETSALSKAFDQILQIAAVRTDGDLNIGDEADNSFTLRARRVPWVVPSPAAMVVTRLTPTGLEVQPLSSYELLAEVTQRFEAWSPAIFIGHNTIRFDEEILRHGLVATLQAPYITQLNGNMRADTLIMLHTVHLLTPGSINIPMVASATATLDGSAENAPKAVRHRPRFRLGDIARANAITLNEADAHDALAGVSAIRRQGIDKTRCLDRPSLSGAGRARYARFHGLYGSARYRAAEAGRNRGGRSRQWSGGFRRGPDRQDQRLPRGRDTLRTRHCIIPV